MLIYKYEYKEYEYDVNIELILFEICLIHMPSYSDSKLKDLIHSSDPNHSLKLTFLVVVAFTNEGKRRRQRQQPRKTHNLPVSTVVFVSESYLYCESCKC